MAMRRVWASTGAAAAILAVASMGAADPKHPTPIPPPIPVHGFQHVLPSVNVRDTVNVVHLQKLKARVPQKCGAREVAPNVWVKIDCHEYKMVPNAKPLVFSVGRVRMLQQGKLRLDPGSLATPPSGGVGGAAPTPNGAVGSASAPASFPLTVDHRQNGTEGPIKNQEYTSACTSFALSATMDNAILRLGANDVSSPSHLWAHYGQPDMADAVSGNLNKPIATWATWPFSPKEGCELSRFSDDCDEHYGVSTNSYKRDAKLEGELSSAEANGKYTITSIQSLTMPANPNDIVAVLATGADLWVAFSLDVNNWGYQALQMNNNVIPDWTSPEGGHAVMLAGYRTASDGSKQFLIHNSWGTDWGDGGYAWVSDRMVKQFMRSAYKIKVVAVGGAPQQQLPLTDDDCDSDELVDAVTGQCSPECSDGSRPSNGVCGTSSSYMPNGPSSTGAQPPAAGQCAAGQVLVGGRCVTPGHF
jgi:hypothetical protein